MGTPASDRFYARVYLIRSIRRLGFVGAHPTYHVALCPPAAPDLPWGACFARDQGGMGPPGRPLAEGTDQLGAVMALLRRTGLVPYFYGWADDPAAPGPFPAARFTFTWAPGGV